MYLTFRRSLLPTWNVNNSNTSSSCVPAKKSSGTRLAAQEKILAASSPPFRWRPSRAAITASIASFATTTLGLLSQLYNPLLVSWIWIRLVFFPLASENQILNRNLSASETHWNSISLSAFFRSILFCKFWAMVSNMNEFWIHHFMKLSQANSNLGQTYWKS